MRIDAADVDLMEQVRETGGIGRVWAIAPDLAYRAPQRVGQREEAGAGLAPGLRPHAAALPLGLVPPDGAAGHFLVDAALAGGDLIGEEGQRLAFEALLAEERRALARRVIVGFRPVPAAEAHHEPSRAARRAR